MIADFIQRLSEYRRGPDRCPPVSLIRSFKKSGYCGRILYVADNRSKLILSRFSRNGKITGGGGRN